MARRATSLGPKPSLFVFVFFGFFFWFSVFFNTKNLVFPLEKGIYCLFSVFLFLFPLAFFDFPLFLFLFPCLSLFFFSFFIPSCLCFLFSFGSLFGSLSLFFFLLWFSFMIGTTSKYSIASFFLHQYFIFCFLPFFVSSSVFLSLLFPDFKLCFLFNIKVFDFQTNNLQKKTKLVKRGVATNGFFYQPVFWKMSKVIVLFWVFFGNFWLMFKNTIKIGISAHFKKQKIEKKTIFNSYHLNSY